MAQSSPHPIRTYSIGFADRRYDETPYALEASDRFGTHHSMRKLEPDCLESWPEALFYCDQPHGDVSFVPTLKLAELAATDVKVVLTGDGGDELFAGYAKYRELFASGESAEREFITRLTESLTLFDGDTKGSLYGDYFAGVDRQAARDYVSALAGQVPHFDDVNKALYVDCRMLLPGNNLVKPDRMAMARSLEARDPFLDFRLVEFAFGIPGTLKLKDAETKYILKRAVASLLGDQLTYRRKQMFTVPIGDWFRTHLRPFVHDTLGTSGLADRGFFDGRFVEQLVREHCEGSINRTRELRALIAVELWIRAFLEASPVKTPWWQGDVMRAADVA